MLLRLHIDLNPDVRRCDAVIWLQDGASAGRWEETESLHLRQEET